MKRWKVATTRSRINFLTEWEKQKEMQSVCSPDTKYKKNLKLIPHSTTGLRISVRKKLIKQYFQTKKNIAKSAFFGARVIALIIFSNNNYVYFFLAWVTVFLKKKKKITFNDGQCCNNASM